MANLTTMQMLVLTSACEQADGIATRPGTLSRSAAVKVAARLIEQGFVQERRAKPGWPVWRLDADNKPFSLKILKMGRAVAKDAAGPTVAASSATATMAGSDVPSGQPSSAVPSGDAPSRPTSRRRARSAPLSSL